MKKFLRSLLAKYMLIILMALVLFQAGYMLIAFFAIGLESVTGETQSEMMNEAEIEENWHEDADSLPTISEETIGKLFAKWKEDYPESSMFWVNGDGQLTEGLGISESLPSQWSPSYTAQFIKERYEGNPYTVLALIGKDEDRGFIVFEIPRTVFNPPVVQIYEQYGTFFLVGIGALILLFIAISFLFFRGIRKRLLHLQSAMELRDTDGLPVKLDIKKNDEIGQLEGSFNQMVHELGESRKREQKEEQLRRELIANLSHDLRTPLTKVRAQTYSLAKENLNAEGIKAVNALEASIETIDRLIENLMSYTLLMASKYTIEPREIDAVRYVRESLALWYPVFEKEKFEIEVNLEPFNESTWTVDPIWLGRIIDNLLQNILRHAKDGLFLGVKTESTPNYDMFIFWDKGKGMNETSSEKGAGIGLSIVDLMAKGMDLKWDIKTSNQGTFILIKKPK